MNMILQTRNLVKTYGKGENAVNVVDGFSFDLAEGEFLSVMGPSGSGKSTLLNCISTIDSPTSGSILINGKELQSLKPKETARFRRENLGFIFQEYNLIDALRVKENIALSLMLNRERKEKIAEEVNNIASLLGIDSLLDKYPYEISGGEKQRTACARAVIHKPKILMADEPSGALDSHSTKVLMETFSEINKKLGTTIIMVTHDAFCASYSGRVLFLKDGKLFSELKNVHNSHRAFYEEIFKAAIALGE
ncbi:ABC transporter ATP-binding protein [Treponema sp. OMZ 791]|uniref:ABC transporter ATP-binding protein n=1 Tax=unclassified Treponema TaxID=2638727 RepID=UPI00220999E2|nr:ABC transporter ATP-binding protein [Treponema sp. OMZ 789]UTC71198.1 ABC transporter ATP-binding protein [Treponema sp. OMZ 790]UTC73914.1 ABC transporter ATP-binding protein [Treponema sp. OMZ 791]